MNSSSSSHHPSTTAAGGAPGAGSSPGTSGGSADTAIHRRVDACRRNDDPTCIGRVAAGWVVMGSPQVLPGYCLLLPDPVVPTLNHLDDRARVAFLGQMATVGDAVLAVTACRRINYELLGNLEPALHAHVVPRYDDEDVALRTRPIWSYDWERAPAFDPVQHGSLLDRLRNDLRVRLDLRVR